MLKSETNDVSKPRERTPRKRNHDIDARTTSPQNVERLLRMRELESLVGVKRSTIHRLVSQGRFPPPLHPFGHGRVAAWKATEIAAWIEARCRGLAA